MRIPECQRRDELKLGVEKRRIELDQTITFKLGQPLSGVSLGVSGFGPPRPGNLRDGKDSHSVYERFEDFGVATRQAGDLWNGHFETSVYRRLAALGDS